MIDNINNVYKRIKNIRNGINNLNNFKPEPVKEFENMYKKAVSNTNSKKTESISIHPYLKNESIDNRITNTSKKTDIINKAINNASDKYKLSEDLIRAVIKTESNYEQYSVSRAGAMGLMQLMPKTTLELGVDKPFDIYQNIDGGTKYLKKMLNKYNGDLDKALAAYNAGPHRVDKADGIPDIQETINYVKKIKNLLLFR